MSEKVELLSTSKRVMALSSKGLTSDQRQNEKPRSVPKKNVESQRGVSTALKKRLVADKVNDPSTASRSSHSGSNQRVISHEVYATTASGNRVETNRSPRIVSGNSLNRGFGRGRACHIR